MDGAGPSRPSDGSDGRPPERRKRGPPERRRGRPPDGRDRRSPGGPDGRPSGSVDGQTSGEPTATAASPTLRGSGPTSRVGDHEAAVERLCYAGESVLGVASLSGGLVGVTTHRVLALTPGDSGPNLQSVDRPNVTGVELSSGGDAGHGLRAVRYGVYALALVGGSYLVDFSGVSAVEPPAEAGAGAGEVIGLALALTSVLTLVDDVLRYAGLGVLVVALVFAALYGYSRDSYLTIGVAGDDAVRVPATASESAAVDRLRVALEAASGRVEGEPTPVEKASNPSAD